MASILEAFLAGKEARRVADAQEQINAMQSFIGQNGQAIMAGDQNALGQLAGFGAEGLGMAMNVQGNVQQRERQTKMDARADQEFQLRLEEHKKSLTAEQAAAEAAAYENAAKIALTAKTPADWDRLATENGAPELVGQFGNREAVAARFMTIAEVLKSQEPLDPTKGAPTGFMFNDPRNPAAGVAPLPGYTKAPDTVVNVGGEGGPQTEIGSIPQGFAAVVDPTSPAGYRMVPIPGGPEDTTETDAQADSNANIASDTIITATKRAINATAEQTFGAPGTSLVAAIPGIGAATPSGEKVRQTKVLRSQAIVGNLQAMRDASPTGGALGAVTKPELDMLADKSGALDPDSPTFERDVLDYTRTLLRVVHGEVAGDAMFRKEFGAPPPATDKPLQLSPEALKWLEE